EASPGFDSRPSSRIMQADMPGPGATHREPAQHDALRVDLVPLAHGLKRFENVGLTCPAIGVVGAPEDFELDEILAGENRLRTVVGGDEAHLVDGGAAAMQDQCEKYGLADV